MRQATLQRRATHALVVCAMFALATCLGLVAGCAEASRIVADTATGRVLVLGDSVMEWNADGDAAIADVIATALGRAVVNAGVSGARLSMPATNVRRGALGYDIRAQYRPRGWEWVVMDGGANDVGGECACSRCERTLDEMVSDDGQAGQYPDFVRDVVRDGSRVLVMGYYFPPTGERTSFTRCVDELETLNARLERMAAALDSVFYAAATDVIDPANLAHFDEDLVHPSEEGSRLIGLHLAQAIRTVEEQ
ncbi:MAG: SGNH/GDSL hydrolase family protein [Bacteroidota bacterium]